MYKNTAILNKSFCSDVWSYIKGKQFGLGRTKRDTDMLQFRPIPAENTSVYYPFDIPDGIPAWIKLRMTDAGMV